MAGYGMRFDVFKRFYRREFKGSFSVEDWELTRREKQVIELMASGRTTKEIAKALDVGVSSIRTHKQNLYGKFGITGEDRSMKLVLAYLGII